MVEKEIKEKLLQIAVEIEKCLLQEKEPILVAVEGSAAAGKTTLANLLGQRFDCNVWHMDDFFLRAVQRTEERLAEVGGNVDYERFREEVLANVLAKKAVSLQKFDCSQMELQEPEIVEYKRLNIVEGIYSTHPYFGDIYELKVFMDIHPEEQEKRIRRRNFPELAEKFFRIWIPKEQAYITKYDVKAKADIII